MFSLVFMKWLVFGALAWSGATALMLLVLLIKELRTGDVW